MSWIRYCLAVSLAACGVLLAPLPAARADGGWRWPLKGDVALEYGARYTDGQGRSCSHGGVDIAAGAGTAVVACAAGEVAFSGLVPAGEGRRAWAVTVLTADGLRVTYLPLERASVGRGESVAAGQVIGDLSASGDASGAAPHLHLGVRRGERALDPASFLAAAESAPQTSPPPAHAPAPSPAPVRPPAVTSLAPRASTPAVRPGSPAVSRAPVSAPAAQVPAARPSAAAPVPSRAPLIAPSPAMPGMEMLNRIAPVADVPRVRTAEVSADMSRLRDLLGAALVRLAVAGVAGACVWPAMRGLLAARVGPVAEPVAIRRGGA